MMPRPDPLPHLAAVAATHAAAEQPQAPLVALDGATAAALGHRLFTVLAIHEGAQESRRYYSSQPQAYPVGGRKPIRADHPWMQQVMPRGEPWIGKDHADIQRAFPDHALIRSLGCESVLNVPVRWAGRTIGTINLLHQAGRYRPKDAATARLFAALAAPALLTIIAKG